MSAARHPIHRAREPVPAAERLADDPLRTLLSAPRVGARHCVRSLACVTGARCVCECATCLP
jgi:hypothetical protein